MPFQTEINLELNAQENNNYKDFKNFTNNREKVKEMCGVEHGKNSIKDCKYFSIKSPFDLSYYN